MNKRSLRKTLRRRRQQLPPALAATAAQHSAEHLIGSPLWAVVKRLGLFLPSDGELDPAPVAEFARADGSSDRAVYLPRLRGETLEFACWDVGAPLAVNRFGIGEPQTPSTPIGDLDLLLMPTVGWTAAGVRLGMGGGFYDRCLGAVEPCERPLLISLAYECQRCEALKADPWDVRVDGVLTENGLRLVSERLHRQLGAPRDLV